MSRAQLEVRCPGVMMAPCGSCSVRLSFDGGVLLSKLHSYWGAPRASLVLSPLREQTRAVCSHPDHARDGVFMCSPAHAPPATRLGTSGARPARTTSLSSARCAPLSQRRARARAPAAPLRAGSGRSCASAVGNLTAGASFVCVGKARRLEGHAAGRPAAGGVQGDAGAHWHQPGGVSLLWVEFCAAGGVLTLTVRW
jgi:hypothetical protein